MTVTPGLRSNLAIYCYVAPTTSFYSPSQLEIGRFVTQFSMESAAPGGYTMFRATLSLRDGRIPRPEFALFSQIEVRDGPNVVWAGELTDPDVGMDETLGEYIHLNALGLGNILRDDPQAVAYTNQTPKQIATNQLTRRNNGSPYSVFPTLSNDTGYLFPDNPAATFSPVYDNRTMEEVLADVCILAGDYQWGVWAHPLASQQNAAGFRLGVISVQKRDATTTHYRASVAERDIIGYNVTPNAERAYNHIRVDYSTTTGGVGTATYVDSRLNATSYAQNKAPFRFRSLVRDYSGSSTIGAAQAQAIANTIGGQYQNPTNKVSFTLRRVSDAYGNPIPLWSVRAGQNIFIRDFAPRGASALPSSPTAGVNQFYIVRAEYREDASGGLLTLDCDNFVDRAETRVARLQLAADVKARTKKTTGVMQVQGAAVTSQMAMGQSNAVNGTSIYQQIVYPNQLYQAPTAISFSLVTSTGIGTPTASNMTPLGALATATTSAGGSVFGVWRYTTSGNCLRAIHETTLDWHCDGCGREFTGLAIAQTVRTEMPLGTVPGLAALAIDCPECGAVEAFNTGLRIADEEQGHGFRREQARLIRQLMRHRAVDLEVLP